MRDGTLGIPDGLIRLWTNPERRLQILALLVGVGVVVAASIVWMLRGDVADVEYWKAFGYPGVFFLSFLGSVSVILPVPGLIAGVRCWRTGTESRCFGSAFWRR